MMDRELLMELYGLRETVKQGHERMEDKLDRIALALESIAENLQRLADSTEERNA